MKKERNVKNSTVLLTILKALYEIVQNSSSDSLKAHPIARLFSFYKISATTKILPPTKIKSFSPAARFAALNALDTEV
ncbi:MAG: hypothetical protein ACI8X3_002126 [Saprospiraceae bacterium]|jgi:hypothetical protein